MNHLYLLTGGNLGDRLANLQHAYKQLEKQVGSVIKSSGVYETAPWGLAEQDLFLNQVLYLKTNLPPGQTLQTILQIERQLGRKRLEKNGPRIIDIDILFYNNEVIATPNLHVPHPEIANRRFVLTPLNEIAPHLTHPVLHQTIAQLLAICPDKLEVKKYHSPTV